MTREGADTEAARKKRSAPATAPAGPARDRVLAAVRAALAGRVQVDHPGRLASMPEAPPQPTRRASDPRTDEAAVEEASAPPAAGRSTTNGASIDRFTAMFEAAGGEVVSIHRGGLAAWWRWATAEHGVAVRGAGVAAWLADDASRMDPVKPTDRGEPIAGAEPTKAAEPISDADATLGVSVARAAIAETGSLVLASDDGRRAQLLPPVHVVLVDADDVVDGLEDWLAGQRHDLPAALGLHSGPSKSADIGQILVRGVHGPGRVIAVILAKDPAPTTDTGGS